MSEKPKKRLVGRTEYVLRKTLAISLSVGLTACGIGGALLLLRLLLGYYLDARTDRGPHWLPPGTGANYDGQDLPLRGLFSAIAWRLCVTVLPILLITGLTLWWGSRKSWKTLRALQPINFADIAALPEIETLVRASDLPPSYQQAELLRATPQGSETPLEELLRATTNR